MLNISKKICYAWAPALTIGILPVAEVVPLGNSTNEKTKLKSVKKKFPTLDEHENVPLPGFTLFKTNRKNWGSADQTWQVIDPRGFLTRITNDNLEDILHCTGITEGLIQEKCVWARLGSQTTLMLVPISSHLYIEATENTELLDEKVTMRDVQIGDKVLLQNGLTGTYMGALSLYTALHGYSSPYKAGVLPKRQIIKVSDKHYHYQVDTKILKVVESVEVPLTRKESAKIINDNILAGDTYFANSKEVVGKYYSNSNMIMHVSTHAEKFVKISLEEVTRAEAETLFYQIVDSGDPTPLVLEQPDGSLSVIRHSRFSRAGISINQFLTNNVDVPTEYSIRIHEPVRIALTLSEYRELDYFVKFYKIVKHVKDETYV